MKHGKDSPHKVTIGGRQNYSDDLSLKRSVPAVDEEVLEERWKECLRSRVCRGLRLISASGVGVWSISASPRFC